MSERPKLTLRAKNKATTSTALTPALPFLPSQPSSSHLPIGIRFTFGTSLDQHLPPTPSSLSTRAVGVLVTSALFGIAPGAHKRSRKVTEEGGGEVGVEGTGVDGGSSNKRVRFAPPSRNVLKNSSHASPGKRPSSPIKTAGTSSGGGRVDERMMGRGGGGGEGGLRQEVEMDFGAVEDVVSGTHPNQSAILLATLPTVLPSSPSSDTFFLDPSDPDARPRTPQNDYHSLVNKAAKDAKARFAKDVGNREKYLEFELMKSVMSRHYYAFLDSQCDPSSASSSTATTSPLPALNPFSEFLSTIARPTSPPESTPLPAAPYTTSNYVFAPEAVFRGATHARLGALEEKVGALNEGLVFQQASLEGLMSVRAGNANMKLAQRRKAAEEIVKKGKNVFGDWKFAGMEVGPD